MSPQIEESLSNGVIDVMSRIEPTAAVVAAPQGGSPSAGPNDDLETSPANPGSSPSTSLQMPTDTAPANWQDNAEFLDKLSTQVATKLLALMRDSTPLKRPETQSPSSPTGPSATAAPKVTKPSSKRPPPPPTYNGADQYMAQSAMNNILETLDDLPKQIVHLHFGSGVSLEFREPADRRASYTSRAPVIRGRKKKNGGEALKDQGTSESGWELAE